MIKIWVDDVRPMPKGYNVCMKSTLDTIHYLKGHSPQVNIFLDLDHDAGDYAKLGGDYYKILDWCEGHGYTPVVHFHSQNPAGVEKMRLIAQHNHWEEI